MTPIWSETVESVLTLRQIYAALAMQGDLAGGFNGPNIAGNAETWKDAAARYFAIADAMIEFEEEEEEND